MMNEERTKRETRSPRARLAATIVVGAALSLWAGAAPNGLETPAEESGYTRYTQNEELGRFLSRAAATAGELTVAVVGRTEPVRDYPAHDIFLAVLTEKGAARPADLDRRRPTLLLTAAQHGNEQSAKEAALRLIRDIALGDLKPLLKTMNVLIMPQTNPYGNRFDVRRNETGLDMNRDHVKLEAAGVRAIHRVFRDWMPEVTIDVHEKGDDYYRVSIGCVSNADISRSLQDYSRQTILAEVNAALAKRSVTFHEYLITEEMGSTSAAGVREPGGRREPREMMTRYSTADLNDGRNSLGIYETLSFIQEGASRHDLETLEARTEWQYRGLRAFMQAAAGHGGEIVKMVGGLRARLVEKAGIYDSRDLVCLKSEYARDPGQPNLEIKEYKRSESPIRGILKVDKKAGDYLTAADLAPYRQPADLEVVDEVIKNWFPEVKPVVEASRPLGYIIPAGHFELVETLLAHGIAVEMFTRDGPVEAEAYEVKEITPSANDYLAPAKITVERKAVTPVIRGGDFYVSCDQPAANLVPCLLEPESEYGLIRYRKFRLVPEAGDMFGFYRVVKPQALPLVPYKKFGVGPQ